MNKQKHYINNEDFLKALVAYKESCIEAEKNGKSKPNIPNYIGECWMKIAEGLSHKPNFINYTYRDEMISAVHSVLTTVDSNDDPWLHDNLFKVTEFMNGLWAEGYFD